MVTLEESSEAENTCTLQQQTKKQTSQQQSPNRLLMEDFILHEIPSAEPFPRFYRLYGFIVIPEFMFEMTDATQERFPHHVSLM